VAEKVGENECPWVKSAIAFDERCDVYKSGVVVDCSSRPGASCHVKDATRAFNRVGDMGKLPTSALLRLWRNGECGAWIQRIVGAENSAAGRARRAVELVSNVCRVGPKLGAMYVSALSTPALAPGLTPWFPFMDGNSLLVIDTNVARAVDVLRGRDAPGTYDARSQWLVKVAANIDLRRVRSDLPENSPRLIQQALYAFGSRSNRTARGDPCVGRDEPCDRCVKRLCPLAGGSRKTSRSV
jgi:hypothetical protein